MQVTTRSPLREAQKRAQAEGLHTFTIDLACPHSHLSPRYASNGNCVQCAKMFRGNPKPEHERQLKLRNRSSNQRVTQISEDTDTINLVTLAKRQLGAVMGRPVSTSIIHKAGIVLLGNYLRGNPTAADINKHATMRQTSGYAEIRKDYLEGLGEHNPTAALNSDLGPGITTYQDAKGRVCVRIPGMGDGMLWKTAIKSFGLRKS